MRFALLLLPVFILSACDTLTPSETAYVSGTVVLDGSAEAAAGLVVYLGSDPVCIPESRCEPPPSIGRPIGRSTVTADGSFSISYDADSTPFGFYVRCDAALPECGRDKAFLRFGAFADGDTLYVRD